MSIAAFVEKPKNKFEGDLYTPVATESFYKKCWMPAIESLNLQWLKVFSIGLSFTKENLPNIISELEELNNWAKTNINKEEQNHLFERVSQLKSMLEKAFQFEGVVIFIG